MNNDAEFIEAVKSLVAENMLETVSNGELINMYKRARAIDATSNITDKKLTEAINIMSAEMDSRGLYLEDEAPVLPPLYEEAPPPKPKFIKGWIGALIVIVAVVGILLYVRTDDAKFGKETYNKAVATLHEQIQEIKSLGMSKEDYRRELENKMAELDLKEKQMVMAEEEIAKIQKNAPICQQTGKPMEFVLTNDPRPQIRGQILLLKEQIEYLQRQIKE